MCNPEGYRPGVTRSVRRTASDHGTFSVGSDVAFDAATEARGTSDFAGRSAPLGCGGPARARSATVPARSRRRECHPTLLTRHLHRTGDAPGRRMSTCPGWASWIACHRTPSSSSDCPILFHDSRRSRPASLGEPRSFLTSQCSGRLAAWRRMSGRTPGARCRAVQRQVLQPTVPGRYRRQ
jgi:hypothetical protein